MSELKVMPLVGSAAAVIGDQFPDIARLELELADGQYRSGIVDGMIYLILQLAEMDTYSDDNHALVRAAIKGGL